MTDEMRDDQFERDAPLTAYALGELEHDEAAKAAVEARLAEDPEARRAVESIRATADALGAAFAAEAGAGAGLGDARRAAVRDAESAPLVETRRRPTMASRILHGGSQWFWGAAGLGVAASLLVVLWPRPNASQDAQVSMATEAPAVERDSSAVRPGVGGGSGGGGGGSGSPRVLRSMPRDEVASGPAPDRSGRASRDAGVASTATPPASAPPPSASAGRTRSSRLAAPGGQIGGGGSPAAAEAVRGRRTAPPPRRPPGPGEVAPDARWRHDRDVAGREPAEFGQAAFGQLVDNPFHRALDAPLSTFSLDVDTVSHGIVRRTLALGQRPPADSVRIEELINYYDYELPEPGAEHPISVSTETSPAPWAPEHRLLRIGVQAKDVSAGQRPDANLVFLLDVSGSMNRPEKLPLVKTAMRMLLDQLGPNDRVAIVVYAGAAGVVLDSTAVDSMGRNRIVDALEQLSAGGSTAGGQGIRLAYDLAHANRLAEGVNRVILCTDGDFNVGVRGADALQRLVESERGRGTFLTVLGFGSDNFQDDAMEALSNHGDATSAYVDSVSEARRVLVEQVGGTLVTVARDVKLQVDFNPAKVQAYRLIGYANRILAAEDFANDAKDAGDIGAGHSMVALYEIVPPGVSFPGDVEPSKYQRTDEGDADAVPADVGEVSDELCTIRLRYKQPEDPQAASVRFDTPVTDSGLADASEATPDQRHAAAVAAFGMLLRQSPYKGGATWDLVRELARTAAAERDPNGRRRAFLELVDAAEYAR